MRRPLIEVLLLAVCCALPLRRARAHDPFEITTLASLQATALTVEVTLTRATAGRLLSANLGRSAPANPNIQELRGLAPRMFRVSAGGAALLPRAHRVALNAEGEVVFHLEYPRPGRGILRFEAAHLLLLPEGYSSSWVLRAEQPARMLGQKILHLEDIAAEATLDQLMDERGQFTRFARLGMHHVFTGHDHLLFLAGVLLPCVRVRTWIGLITCFTIAHSITLAATLLGALRVPSAIVEPLIAASIVFVGIENLYARGEPRYRFAVTSAFGLVHGLGFADALRQAGGDAQLAWSLLGFNSGVELAQIALAGVFVPLLFLLRRQAFGASAIRASSALVVLIGCYWMVERVFAASG